MTIRKLLLFLIPLCLAIINACSTGMRQDSMSTSLNSSDVREEDSLYSWFQQSYEEDLADSPEEQTYLGLINDLDAYGRWDDPSDQHFYRQQKKFEKRLAYMRNNFAVNRLSANAKTSFRFAEFIMENSIRQAEFRDNDYVFSQFYGPHVDMTSLLIGYHRIDNVEHANAYIRRLQSLASVLDIYIDQAEKRARAGVLPPLFAYPVIINTARGIISGAPFDANSEDSPLLADFREKLLKLGLQHEQEKLLLERASVALKNKVGPVYTRLISLMQQHEGLADNRDGVWKLPRGADYYQAKLANYTTRDDLDAIAIHQQGLEEVARIHTEMRSIMARLDYRGTLQEFFVYLRESDRFYYPNTEAGRSRYLREAAAIIDKMMMKAPSFFAHLPRAKLEVRQVEDYRIETATGAFYESSSLDGSRPGAYYVNLSDMRQLPVYQMETLAYHEGVPGHHFQGSIAQELDNTPMFQKLSWYSAYGEGWALYAESLGKDIGFFEDPYQDFGRLSYEVFRAARLVVDTGIHHFRWTEKDAFDYMIRNTPMTDGDIREEVRRYIVWPGQAVSYKIGMLTILALRQRTMDSLDNEFDWGEFHDVILGNGSVPLKLLGDLVDTYIEEKMH